MALPQVRTSIIYLDGLKIQFAKSNSLDVNTNSQPQVGVDGYIGHSVGAIITKLEFDEIIPTSKLQSNAIKKYLLARKSCVVTYLSGGTAYTFEGVIVQATITAESMNGTLIGKFSIEGGEPRILILTSWLSDNCSFRNQFHEQFSRFLQIALRTHISVTNDKTRLIAGSLFCATRET